MKWVIVLLLPVVTFAESKEELIQYYKARYEDFFERIRREEARDQERLSGRAELKEERQKERELREIARKRYVESKPPPRDMSQAYQEYLKELAAKEKAYLELQQRFSIQQRELEKVKEGRWQIPPILEYGLQDQL